MRAPTRPPLRPLLLGLALAGPALGGAPPFLDLETGERVLEPGVQVSPWAQRCSPAAPRVVAGFGMPLALHWDPRPEAGAARLSCREGATVVRLEVTGLDSVVLRPRRQLSGCLYEALRPVPGRPGLWLSQVQELQAGVRGLLPFAGHPEGPAEASVLARPAGLAMVGGGLHLPERCVAADPGRHRILLFSRDGSLLASWGGEPGHRDGGPLEARFQSPAFVAAVAWFPTPEPWQTSPEFLVADSGNQVLRRVDAAGRVTTLAGVPGQAGHRDADDPRQALFSDPQGLVMHRSGSIFVADRGNRVIRRIARNGQVTTLAGAPGQAGDRDGAGAQARFSALRGLALGDDDCLYALDGHALRRITLRGEVSTVLGRPGTPGFQDARAPGPGGLAGVPCLRGPRAVTPGRGSLLIADTGNHAVREFQPRSGTLLTLAGDPDRGEVRCGLLRDGLEGPLPAGYGTLARPRGLAAGQCGEILVATGPGLLLLARQHLPDQPAPAAELRPERPDARVGEPLRVDFQVPAGSWRSPGGRPIQYTLEFRNGDGTLAERRDGTGAETRALAETGRFTAAGPGLVRLRWVTDQGCSGDAKVPVAVSWPP